MKLRDTDLADTIRYLTNDATLHLTVPNMDVLLDFDHPLLSVELHWIPRFEPDMVHEDRQPPGKHKRGTAHAAAISQLMRDEHMFPPIMILGQWMFDGKHRVHASRIIGRTSIRAIDLEGFATMETPFFWKIDRPRH